MEVHGLMRSFTRLHEALKRTGSVWRRKVNTHTHTHTHTHFIKNLKVANGRYLSNKSNERERRQKGAIH